MGILFWDGTTFEPIGDDATIVLKPRLRWRIWWALQRLALPALLGMAGGALYHLLQRHRRAIKDASKAERTIPRPYPRDHKMVL